MSFEAKELAVTTVDEVEDSASTTSETPSVASSSTAAYAELVELVKAAAAVTCGIGARIEQMASAKQVTAQELLRLNREIVKEFKNGSLRSTFAASNAAQVRLRADAILDLAKTDLMAAIEEFSEYTGLTNALIFKTPELVHAAIDEEFKKREAGTSEMMKRRPAPDARTPEGGHTHRGRGRGGHGGSTRVPKPEATESETDPKPAHEKRGGNGNSRGRGTGRGAGRGGGRVTLADLQTKEDRRGGNPPTVSQ